MPTDVGREEDMGRLAAAAVRAFGGFDTWVNNAGLSIGLMTQTVPGDTRATAPSAGTAGGQFTARTATGRDGTLAFDVARDAPATDGGANRPGGGTGRSETLPPLRLDFAPTGTVRVSEVATGNPAAGPTGVGAGVVRPGVYVTTRDYLAISVMPTPAAGVAAGAARDGGSVAGGGASGDAARPYLTLVLQRAAGGC